MTTNEEDFDKAVAEIHSNPGLTDEERDTAELLAMVKAFLGSGYPDNKVALLKRERQRVRKELAILFSQSGQRPTDIAKRANRITAESQRRLHEILGENDFLKPFAQPGDRPISLFDSEAIAEGAEQLDEHHQLALKRLFEDARRQSARRRAPTLTLRLVHGQPDHFLAGVERIADLCRMEMGARHGVWADAPPASIARHFLGGADTTEALVDRLSRACKVAAHEEEIAAAVSNLRPRQAYALALLLIESSRGRIQAQFIVTKSSDEVLKILEFCPAPDDEGSWRPEVVRAGEMANAKPEIYSEEVPQANTVRQVFDAVDAMIRKGEVTEADISNIRAGRQVYYYMQAARILRFFDQHNEPTELGRMVNALKGDAKMAAAAAAFEGSEIGIAWRSWAGKKHLSQVDANSAMAFLGDRAVGISGSTVPRRASTLRKWHDELMPFYRE